MGVSPAELRDYVLYQAGAMKAFAEAAGGQLQHVKPHGALYTMVQDDAELAQAVAAAVAELGDGVSLLLAGANVEQAAREAGVAFVPEGYVDLDYSADGTLVIERAKQVRDPEATARRAVRLVVEGTVPTLDGGTRQLTARSICVHGDAPNAPEIASAIRHALESAGAELTRLADL
jgi:UPF0271 protein